MNLMRKATEYYRLSCYVTALFQEQWWRIVQRNRKNIRAGKVVVVADFKKISPWLFGKAEKNLREILTQDTF